MGNVQYEGCPGVAAVEECSGPIFVKCSVYHKGNLAHLSTWHRYNNNLVNCFARSIIWRTTSQSLSVHHECMGLIESVSIDSEGIRNIVTFETCKRRSSDKT